jgi:hypothetical protein
MTPIQNFIRFVTPGIFFSMLCACGTSTNPDPRFYDHDGIKKTTDPVIAPAARGPRPELPASYTITDVQAETGNEVLVRLTRTNDTSTVETGSVVATYEVPGDAAHAGTPRTYSFSGQFGVPIYLKAGDQPLALTRMEVKNGAGASLRAYESNEVALLRSNARKGVAMILALAADGQALASSQVFYPSIPPIAAVPNTRYVAAASLPGEPTIDQLREISSATVRFHDDLVAWVDHTTPLDIAHLKLYSDAVYFSWLARERMGLAAAGLTSRIDSTSIMMREVILDNLTLADRLGVTSNQIISRGMAKVIDLDPASGMDLLNRLYPNEAASGAFKTFIKRFPSLSTDTSLELLALAKAKAQFEVAAQLAGGQFKNNSDHSAAALLDLSAGIPKGAALDAFIDQMAPLILEARPTEIQRLIGKLASDAAIMDVAPMLVAHVPGQSARQIVELLATLPLSTARDKAVIASLAGSTPVTVEDARAVLSVLYLDSSTQAAAKKLFARMPSLMSEQVAAVAAQFYRGPQRDGVLREGAHALHGGLLSVQLTDLMSRGSTAASRYAIFEGAATIVSDFTVANAITMGDAVTETPSDERDSSLLISVELVTDLSLENLPLLAARASTPAKRDSLIATGRARLAFGF